MLVLFNISGDAEKHFLRYELYHKDAAAPKPDWGCLLEIFPLQYVLPVITFDSRGVCAFANAVLIQWRSMGKLHRRSARSNAFA
jgi:hypothetical protein